MNKPRFIPQNTISLIALFLFAWSIINWILSFPPFGGLDFPITFQPFVALDSLFPNPDNDPDGPFVIGTVFLQLFSTALATIGYFLHRSRHPDDKASKTLMIISLILSSPIILTIINELIPATIL